MDTLLIVIVCCFYSVVGAGDILVGAGSARGPLLRTLFVRVFDTSLLAAG